MSDAYHVYHQYWVNKKPLNSQKQFFYGNLSFAQLQGVSGSTIYKCKRMSHDPQIDTGNFYAMKVISYKKDKKKISKASYNQHVKNYEQIKTQYQALSILGKCHRVSKLQQIINENPKRKDDRQFFHDFLGKPKIADENYICFVTQFCNQGNLEAIIEKKKGGISEEDVIFYGSQIIQGLIQLKKKKIIHRDLRLCNILVHNNQIKFSDFDTSFIGGLSTYLDVKNGIDNNTAPPQIIDLSSMSDQSLQKFDSDKLYRLQEKSDIYFFGLALHNMIFGTDCRDLDEDNLINQISAKIVDQNFNPELLEIMRECLEENADKRMDLLTLVERFSELERIKYYQERTINRLYLSQEPVIFVSHKISDLDIQNLSKLDDKYSSEYNNINILEDHDFSTALKQSTDSHLTTHYKNFFAYKNITNLHELWKMKESQKQQNQQQFLDLMEEFIRNVGTRSFYYECLYKVILSINMRSIKIKTMHSVVKKSKKLLQKQITNVLTFLLQLLLEQPFKEDKYYKSENLPYEARRLFNTIIKSDILQNKKDCYSGKAKQFEQEDAVTVEKIKKFHDFQYQKSQSFKHIYMHFIKIMKEIDFKVKILLKDTIIKLGFAYQNAHHQKEAGNIKEILFILILLEQQNLNSLQKNQIIVIWTLLMPLLNEQFELQRYQVQAFLRQHKKINPEIQTKANQQCNLVSATYFLMNSQKVNESSVSQNKHKDDGGDDNNDDQKIDGIQQGVDGVDSVDGVDGVEQRQQYTNNMQPLIKISISDISNSLKSDEMHGFDQISRSKLSASQFIASLNPSIKQVQDYNNGGDDDDDGNAQTNSYGHGYNNGKQNSNSNTNK